MFHLYLFVNSVVSSLSHTHTCSHTLSLIFTYRSAHHSLYIIYVINTCIYNVYFIRTQQVQSSHQSIVLVVANVYKKNLRLD